MKSIVFSLVIVSVFFLKRECYSQSNSKIKFGVSGYYEKSGASALVPDKQNVFNYGSQIDYRLSDSKKLIESGIVLLTRGLGVGNEQYKYLQIPVKFKVEILFFYFAMGGYADIFYSNNYDTSIFGKKTKYGYLLNIGAQKNIYDNWNIFIVAESTNNIVDEEFSNYGIGIGINYVLK